MLALLVLNLRVFINPRKKFLFDIFDVDRRGKVSMPEFDAMLRMLYASQDADLNLVKLLAVNGSDDEDELSFDEFVAVSLQLGH